MYGYFNNDPLLSCSAFHYVSTMLFPISNIHEKKQENKNNKQTKKDTKTTTNKRKRQLFKNKKTQTKNTQQKQPLK